MLAILDGWGWREEAADNAIRQAHTPNLDRLWADCPHALLRASGKDVGLPAGQMGNSEVGHLNIGAGRIVMQDLPRISDAIESGEIEKQPALRDLITRLEGAGRCHLMGLVSPGGVHSHQDHAVELARILAAAGIPTFIHVWTDGRDTPPQSAAGSIRGFMAAMPPSIQIATVSGRYYAMDRDKRWERTAKAYAAMVLAEGPRFPDAPAVVADAYAHDVHDEFIVPAVVGDYAGMRDGDGVLCFNFRADRVRQILTAILDPAFSGFARARVPTIACAVGMTEYSDELNKLMRTIFPPQPLMKTLGEIVASAGRRQLRAAETEKYAHVSYFLNGGREDAYPGEDRILVPSPKVATYDLKPEMSAPELTDKVVAAIDTSKYDLIVLNYANPDMVGHTGSLPAAIEAVETVDAGLGRIADAISRAGGALIVTADHGNCELMRDPETGGPHTAHTTNPVPVFLLGGGDVTLTDGRLADVAPTLLALMGLPQPKEMGGISLLRSAAPERQKARV
jgi:2,3-bisphosphoglycerate-independent phosphoglycerate mutase